MKKLVLATLLLTSNCFAGALHDFDAVKTAVMKGKTIHMVVDFTQCNKPMSGMEETIGVSGVFTPNEMLIVKNNIFASFVHFTTNNPRYNGKPVFEYVRYAITDANSVRVSFQTLAAADYTPLNEKSTVECKMDGGASIYDRS